ncbi:hypothetical protein [Aequorivita capsosiphonis]|uniref:hypothetical protein n=1 Tax=Aequorivita capsosiphonis TaxID=487317 RepID=UPI0004197873|nr:hypothetical protein [Aequorivita capsosiphonis]
MNIKLFILYFLALSSTNLAIGQQVTSSSISVSPVPNEAAYLDVNSSLFFVGEYLYYKIYVKNTATNQLTSLSKIGYVELIQEDGKTVFKQQLVLENGISQGDFFIPTDVVSGNYKIVGYTQNMLVKSDENFFQQDIGIINPYRGDQTAISELKTEDSDTLTIKNISEETSKDYDFTIHLDKNKYSNRSAVNLSLSTESKNIKNGTYSLSVRKKNEIDVPQLKTSLNYRIKQNNPNVKEGTTRSILPELRGKLISGKIVSTNPNQSVKGKKVTLSIPGDDYVFKVSDVAENGNFYFNIDKPHSQNKALFQVIGDTEDNFNIQLDSLPSINKASLKFNKFTITPQMQKMIEERSIHNQIENAYYHVKPDTIKTKPLEKAYYGKTFTTYVLDEYTRFPTMKETMIEIVENAWLQTNSDGRSKFVVREPEGYGRTNNPLLLLVDGVFLQSHDLLANFKAAKVESISVLRDRYYLGSQTFQGVMIVQTKDNDFNKYLDEDFILQTQLLPDQPVKSYFSQEYNAFNESKTTHIPDYRRQLLWQPHIKMEEGEMGIKFFTSDISGNFEVRLEGFMVDGSPVSFVKTFTVE